MRGHELVAGEDDKGKVLRWKCVRCEKFRAPYMRGDFYKFDCKGALKTGETAGSRARQEQTRKKLEEEWRKSKPGHHHLRWSGDTQGAIVCTLCTRRWPYRQHQQWKVQIQQTCANDGGKREDEKRRKLQEALDEAAEKKEVGEHVLARREEDDTVFCSRCLGTTSQRLWRYMASQPCIPAEEGKTVEEVLRDKKGGAARKAATRVSTGLFGAKSGEAAGSSSTGSSSRVAAKKVGKPAAGRKIRSSGRSKKGGDQGNEDNDVAPVGAHSRGSGSAGRAATPGRGEPAAKR